MECFLWKERYSIYQLVKTIKKSKYDYISPKDVKRLKEKYGINNQEGIIKFKLIHEYYNVIGNELSYYESSSGAIIIIH